MENQSQRLETSALHLSASHESREVIVTRAQVLSPGSQEMGNIGGPEAAEPRRPGSLRMPGSRVGAPCRQGAAGWGGCEFTNARPDDVEQGKHHEESDWAEVWGDPTELRPPRQSTTGDLETELLHGKGMAWAGMCHPPPSLALCLIWCVSQSTLT